MSPKPVLTPRTLSPEALAAFREEWMALHEHPAQSPRVVRDSWLRRFILWLTSR